MQSEKDDDGIPREVRMFGYSMLVVHMQKLDYLIGVAQERGIDTTTIEQAHRYLEELSEGGPDEPAFADWVREALEMSHALIEEEDARPVFRVIDGGKGDG
jgi:hypothetical protein